MFDDKEFTPDCSNPNLPMSSEEYEATVLMAMEMGAAHWIHYRKNKQDPPRYWYFAIYRVIEGWAIRLVGVGMLFKGRRVPVNTTREQWIEILQGIRQHPDPRKLMDENVDPTEFFSRD